MGVQKFVHRVVHGLRAEVLVDRHDDFVLVRARETHGLAELVVLVQAGLAGLDDDAATGDQVADGIAADGHGADAQAADFQEAATAQDEGGGALGVIVFFRQHFSNILASRKLDAQRQGGGRMEPGRAGGLNRLTAAVDATARAVHDFDEVVTVLVDADAVENFLEALIRTVDDTDADFEGLAAECLDGHGDGRFDDGVVVAADNRDVAVLEVFAGKSEVGRTQSSFHHAARAAEDRAGARIHFERTAFAGLRFEQGIDALAAHEFGDVAGRERGVDVLEGGRVLRDVLVGDEVTPGRVHFRTRSFEDLGRAGRDGDEIDLTGIALEDVLRSPGLGERTAHLERGLRRGEVRKHVGVIRFGVLHPGRAAGREVRERVLALFVDFRTTFAEDPILDLLNEFRAFFDDGLVGRAVAVVDHEAELFKRVDHLFGRERTGLAAEFFAERNANGGRGLGHDHAVLVGEDVFDFVDEAHLLDRVERAGDQALTAVEARVFNDFVLGAETALDGVDRTELAAGVAPDAVVLVDVDDPTQFALAKIAVEGGAIFPAGVVTREERMDLDRIRGHGKTLQSKESRGARCGSATWRMILRRTVGATALRGHPSDRFMALNFWTKASRAGGRAGPRPSVKHACILRGRPLLQVPRLDLGKYP